MDNFFSKCPFTGYKASSFNYGFNPFLRQKVAQYRVKHLNIYKDIILHDSLYLLIKNGLEDKDNTSIYLEFESYIPHFMYEMSKNSFKYFFGNIIYWTHQEGVKRWFNQIFIKERIDFLYPELPSVTVKEERKRLLILAIYAEQDFDFSKILITDDLKFRVKSYIRNLSEFSVYLEDLQEQKLIKVENEYVRFTPKGLDYIENGFKHMKDLNNPIINNGNLAINNGNGNTSNQTQNINNTFSSENKNDIKEIIQFLKENVEHLNLSNDDVIDIKNEVQILESQINRESPKKERINSALGIIQSMLISITANLYTPKVEAIVTKIGGLIGNVPIG